jgi:hypothetical protein
MAIAAWGLDSQWDWPVELDRQLNDRNVMKVLLVEPEFPIPAKSRNHSHFLPVGLLKIGSYHRQLGDTVKLVRGQRRCGFKPDKVLITSLFTYWSRCVHEAAAFYHKAYPNAKIEIGGIYASLMPDHCKKKSPYASIRRGLYRRGAAEKVAVDYALLPLDLDYQVIHTSRGCPRRCTFCGTWRIEPTFRYERSAIPKIQKRKLIFYDNNLLANPNIDIILGELRDHRMKGGVALSCESQSGFDLGYLTPARARMLKDAHFIMPRIAWDGSYATWPKVRKAVRLLKDVGYGRRDIFIFMVYNHRLPYGEMRKKLDACRRWRVRVIDCRYRPLDLTEDNYCPGSKPQRAGEYYIHAGWTDRQVRGFRRAVRRQNIAIMLDLPEGRYVQGCERCKVSTMRRRTPRVSQSVRRREIGLQEGVREGRK